MVYKTCRLLVCLLLLLFGWSWTAVVVWTQWLYLERYSTMLQRRSLGDQDQSPPLTLNASLTFKNGALCKVDYSSAEGRDGRGSGMLRCPSGMSYQGEFLGLRRDGEGEQRWPNGSYYQGDFKNDQRDGKGQFIWSCGHVSCS